MKIHLKFLSFIFFKSFFYVFSIFLSLVLILNLLNEIEFFKNIEINNYYPIYLSFLNSPSIIFEIFPFIFLISTQFFFIRLFENNEIQIFKYSGFKNSKLIIIISFLTFLISLILILIFYNFSSNLKKIYLEFKNQYTSDSEYLAVITKNGLWLKDIVENKTNFINASKIEKNFLMNTTITQFDENHFAYSNIFSEKIDITTKEWLLINPSIVAENKTETIADFKIKSNFDYNRIQSLFSDLTSLTILGLMELRKNYRNLNYSTIDVDIHLHRLIAYPFYLISMVILSSIIMLNSKEFKNSTIKISIGLFFSVIIYYLNNIFNLMGQTEKIPIILSIWSPIILLYFINSVFLLKINEK